MQTDYENSPDIYILNNLLKDHTLLDDAISKSKYSNNKEFIE